MAVKHTAGRVFPEEADRRYPCVFLYKIENLTS